MPLINKVKNARTVQLSEEPAALAGEYLRSFTSALAQFADFDQFLDCLKSLVGEDAYLKGTAALSDPFTGQAELPDFEGLDANETVVAITGTTGSLGYLKYSGRHDANLFSAEDMHLMGSLAGMVAALVKQAHQYRQKSKSEQVLQYLINQLPLGVVCLDARGALLVQSNRARRLLGEGGLSLFDGVLAESIPSDGKVQLHFEIEGRLIYSEGRSMEVAEGMKVYAFVLYDMSSYRTKLIVDLEKEAYRSESRGAPLTIAVMESVGEPGELYSRLKGAADLLKMDPAGIQPLDAYRTVCLFQGRHAGTVRFLLGRTLSRVLISEFKISIVSYRADSTNNEPAQTLLDQALGDLKPASIALMPKLVVFDRYPAVFESLNMILSETCHLMLADSVESAIACVESGKVEGIFIDLDANSPEVLHELKSIVKEQGGSFQFYYCTCKHRSMLDLAYGLSINDIVLSKPFDTAEVLDVVELAFELA
ncbi:MAG: hypothetical protein ACSHX8_03050 [Opitutaceae bacterium]